MSTFTFNFKKQFRELVREGKKKQTIRLERKDGRLPFIGQKVKLYYGMRTKQIELLRESVVKEVFTVRMLLDSQALFLNEQRMPDELVEEFARLDGFESAAAMFDWFRKTHSTDYFKGFCTRWS